MPTNLDNVTVTIAEDGTATLTGLDYNDLRSLLTAASLHCSDHPAKASPLDGSLDEVQHDNNLSNFRWHLDRRLILDVLKAKFDHAISPKYCTGDISNAKRMHAFEAAQLEDEVRAAEAKAATNDTRDLGADALNRVAKAIKDADSAIAELRQITHH